VFWGNIGTFLPPKPEYEKIDRQRLMIKNYFVVAWRSLMKKKLFSFINIAGLSTGLASCMLILLYIHHELSYDKSIRDGDRLYQVGGVFITDGKEDRFPCSPAITAANMRTDFPEISQTARMVTFSFFGENKTILQSTRTDGTLNSFYEQKGSAADNSFLLLFNYHFIEGDIHTALNQPNTVVVSAALATTLFGTTPALNKTIRINSSLNGVHDCLVTGVFQPGEVPSHADPNFIMSLYGGSIEQRMRADGTNMAFDNMYTTYVLLKPGVDAHKLQAKFPAFIEKYAGKDFREGGLWRRDFLLPVADIHLHADMMEMTPGGNLTYLYILGTVAVFILLLACINFMNLSTAHSQRRSMEVGVRKVLGARKSELVGQFLGESLWMAFIAFIVALGLVASGMPLFDRLAGQSLTVNSSSIAKAIAFFAILAGITGLVAGSYPAFYLSSFKPAAIFKDRGSSSFAGIQLRKVFVVFQFVISVTLIIVTLVVSDQLHFLRRTDLGFAKDHQMVIPLQSKVARSLYKSLKNEWRADPRIVSVGAGAYYPGIVNASSDNFHKKGQFVDAGQLFYINHVDEDFLRTLDMKMVAGRMFDLNHLATDTLRHVIINEESVRKVGFASPQEAVGQRLISTYKGETNEDEIIGVVKDFHYESLHVPITPFVFYLNNKDSYHYAIVHVSGNTDVSELVTSLGTVWHKLDPGEPFTFSFLDDDFQKNYAADRRLSSIINGFATLAILISCLGLFGLTSFSTEQRLKEIGIRKVLGAGMPSLVILLAKGFLRLVSVAVLIALPIGYWIVHRWLQGFSAQVEIGWPVFAATAGIVMVIALATISVQVVRAALTNPVNILKNE
jgi:putative ABC transport system permease protein